MSRILTFIVTFVLVFSLAGTALGVGVLSETDLMATPTADTLRQNTLGIGINFSEGKNSFLNFDLGLTDEFELGVAVHSYPDDSNMTLRGKYRLLKENGNNPSLAIGIQDIGNDDISPYITVAKSFSEVDLRGYLGVGGGSFDGLFAGLSKDFSISGSGKGGQLSKVQLYLEADSYGLNIGTKLFLGPNAKINFGLIDMDYWIIGMTFNTK